MNIPGLGNYNKFCFPLKVHIILSLLMILGTVSLIGTGVNPYCLDLIDCDRISIPVVLVCKLIYVYLWALGLKLLCNSGYSIVAWFLVFAPFIIVFALFIIGLFVAVKDANKVGSVVTPSIHNK